MPADEPAPLPPGLDLLWGRRERGKRGPRAGLSAGAIAAAAIRLADAEGLEAVSMARVAHELGFTTMSLYRHVASKDELLQLMWNASALGAEDLVLEGDGWRPRLRMWATVQREMLDRHPWITQMPLAVPPLAPNSLTFVEHGLQALDGTGLADADKLRVIEKPLAILTLHVIIAKTHPNARTMLYYFNSALDKLKASGAYDQIVEKHLQQFWDSQTVQTPKVTSDKTPPKTSSDTSTDGTVTATAKK